MVYVSAPAVAKTPTRHQANPPLLPLPAPYFSELLENSGAPFSILGKARSTLEGPSEFIRYNFLHIRENGGSRQHGTSTGMSPEVGTKPGLLPRACGPRSSPLVTTVEQQPREEETGPAGEKSPEIPREKAEPREGSRAEKRHFPRPHVAGVVATRPVTHQPSRSDSGEGRELQTFSSL